MSEQDKQAEIVTANLNATTNSIPEGKKVEDEVQNYEQNIQMEVNDNLVEDIDEAIWRSGGFSKFQMFTFTWIVFGMVSGAFVLYSISYFELEPAYECVTDPLKPNTYNSCQASQFCDGTYKKWRVNWNDFKSLHNWVEQMDLYCTSSITIGWLGSSFFVGCFIGSFILPRAADVVGRKPMFLTGLALYICVVIATLFCTNVYLMMCLMGLGGISETGRYYVAYVYVVEMMPEKYQSKAGLGIFVVFGFAMTYIALQFWFIVKYWQVNAGIALFFAVISLITVTFFVPESPRFYYSKKRFQECREVMSKMHKMNKGQPIEFIFKAEKKAVQDSESSGTLQNYEEKLTNSQIEENEEQQEMIANRAAAQSCTEQDLKEARDEMKLKGDMKELFKISIYRRNLLLLMTIWSFGAFSFFLVPYYLATIDLNVFLMSTMTALGEIIASGICWFITSCMPIKKSLSLFSFVTFISSVGIMVYNGFFVTIEPDGSLAPGESQAPEAACYLFLYVGVTCVFDLVYLIVNELFPTIFTATAYGACNVLGRFITITAPLVARAPHPWPMIILTCYSLICVFVPMFLIKFK